MSATPNSKTTYWHRRRGGWHRHWTAWRRAWAERRTLDVRYLSPDARDFLPAALSIQETPVHPLPLWTARLLMLLAMLALAWACLGRVDIVAVASGRVIVSERSKPIQSLGDALVHRVWVHDGDRVAAGQLLIELDATEALADRQRIQEAWAAAWGDTWRAERLLHTLDSRTAQPEAGSPEPAPSDLGLVWSAEDTRRVTDQLRTEWFDIRARMARAQTDVEQRRSELQTARAVLDKLQAALPWSQRRETDYLALVEEGFISNHATQDRTRERIEIERDIATQKARLRELDTALDQARSVQSALVADIRRSLLDQQMRTRTLANQLMADARKAGQRQRLTELRSPVSGTVQQLAVHSKGGVVAGGQDLLVVVPDVDAVTAEVQIANQDIGFVQYGQSARVKLEAFPFTRYGTLDATVAVLGADAKVNERTGQATFPAYLTLPFPKLVVDGKAVSVTPGMNLVAEIKTGQRRVIDYLLSPVRAAFDESLRER